MKNKHILTKIQEINQKIYLNKKINLKQKNKIKSEIETEHETTIK